MRVRRSGHAYKMASDPNRGRILSCAEAMAAERDASSPPRRLPSRPHSPDQEHDFVEEPPGDYYCAVSLELLLEPHQTDCCGHHLSRSVVERLQRDRKPCPLCARANFQTHPDIYMRRKVRELKVWCGQRDAGCEWSGDLGNKEAHTRSCPKQPWRCPHCGFASLRESSQQHLDQCEQVPVPCPNGCETGQVPRSRLSGHLDKDCPLQPVACPFSHVGCATKLTRCEVDPHTQSMQQHHMMLMCSANLDLSRQMNERMRERDAEMDALAASVARMEKEMNRQFQALEARLVEQSEAVKAVMCEVVSGEDVKGVKREIGALGERVKAMEMQLRAVMVSHDTPEGKVRHREREMDRLEMEELVRARPSEMSEAIASIKKKKRSAHTVPTAHKSKSKTQLVPTASYPLVTSLMQGEKAAMSFSSPPLVKSHGEEDANCEPQTSIPLSRSMMELQGSVSKPNLPPCEFRVKNFSKLKDHNKEWRSDPFYSPEGYKMCLGVWPNGFRSGSGTHVSIEFYKMKDANTDGLKWNVKLPVHIRIYNFKSEKWEREHVNGETFTRSKVSGEFETSGYAQSHKLIPHDDLMPYLHDDTLRIKVEKFELKM